MPCPSWQHASSLVISMSAPPADFTTHAFMPGSLGPSYSRGRLALDGTGEFCPRHGRAFGESGAWPLPKIRSKLEARKQKRLRAALSLLFLSENLK
jgi:hypothetical protein